MTDQNPYGQQQPGQPGQPEYQQQGPGQMPPQGYYQQPPAPKKKPWYKRAVIMVPLTLVVLLVLIIGGCTALVGGAVNEVDKQMNTDHTVTYSITGDATDATATYNVGETNTSQDTGIAAGWTKEATVTGLFGASLTATNGMNDTGAITCQILVNGQVINENTATGEFATANCSASSTDIENATE